MEVETFTRTRRGSRIRNFIPTGRERSEPPGQVPDNSWATEFFSRRWQGREMWIEDWTPSAACRKAQPDERFVRGAEQNKAKQLCTGCPVRTECLAEALDNQIEWGVWGGMTERERRALLRRRPDASWRSVLEQAREQGSPLTAKISV